MTTLVRSARHLGTFPRTRAERWVLVGQDGGQSIDVGGRTLLVFSDTLLVAADTDERLFLANSAATTDAGDLREGLGRLTYLSDEDGFPVEIVPATERERAARLRFWPVHGVADGDAVWLFYLGIQTLSSQSVWDFRNVGVGVARVDPVNGRSERVLRDGDWRLWPARGDDFHFGVQVLVEDGHAYVFGSRRDELRIAALLGRAPVDRIAEPNAYEYFDGASGRWGPTPPSDGGLGPCGSDYSVSANEYLGRYLMVYVDSFSKTLAVRVADRIEGPYSPPELVGRLPHAPSSDLVYLAFEHPQFASDGGRRIVVSYCEPRFRMCSLLELCLR
jgi:hypothetical protein